MSPPAALSEPELDLAAQFVQRLTGLVFPESRRAALGQAVRAAMARARAGDTATYLARLQSEPALLDDLAADVTIGESYFFRTPEQFAVLAEELAEVRPGRNGRLLRIWSAGCAAGEEPYSLAILLHQLGLAGTSQILATDISRPALGRGQRARYGRWALRDVPGEVVRTWFRRVGDEFELSPAIRDAVEFRYLNLAEDSYPSLATGVWGMDLILCRNVLIYFGQDAVTRVVRRLVDSLAEDGVLVLGPSDPSIADRVECEVRITRGGLVYRRARAGVRAAPALRLLPPERPEPGAATPGEACAAESVPAASALLAARPGVREERAVEVTEAAQPIAASAEPSPPGEASLLGEAAACYAEGRYGRAAELASEAARRDPADAAPWTLLVRSLANEGRLEDAGRWCAAALDRHRTSAELTYLHAVLLIAAGRTGEAITAARRALYLDRFLVVAHLLLGTALGRAGELRAARRSLRNAERLLAAVPPDRPVPMADGEPAGRLAMMVRVQLSLLEEAAA